MNSKLPQNSDQIQLAIVTSSERSISVSDAAVTLAGPQLRTAESLFGICKTGVGLSGVTKLLDPTIFQSEK